MGKAEDEKAAKAIREAEDAKAAEKKKVAEEEDKKAAEKEREAKARMKYYKHPWINTTMTLKLPRTDRDNKRTDGLSINLINFRYKTDDLEIQELIKKKPVLVEIGGKEYSLLQKGAKAGPTYTDGPEQLVSPGRTPKK